LWYRKKASIEGFGLWKNGLQVWCGCCLLKYGFLSLLENDDAFEDSRP